MNATTHKNAHRALKKAKEKVRTWREKGLYPEDPPLPFGRSKSDQREIRRLVREADEPEPFARYLAPYRLALQKHIS